MTTAPTFNWLAFAPYLEQAALALKANAPRPAAPEMTMADAAAALKAAEPQIAALDAWLKANPGAVTAVLRVLAGLEAQHIGWASELSEIVSGVPGGLDAAENWIPGAVSALAMFAPGPGRAVGIA